MKTSTIDLEMIKISDGWMDLSYDLFQDKINEQYSDEDEANFKLHEKANKVFEYGEYANLEIEVDENLNIVGGRIIPFKEDWNE